MDEEVRISRHLMFMEIAHTVAKRATCMRLNVGAVLVADRQIVSIGYNGAPPGAPHCEGHLCLGSGKSCTRTVHAERNALDRSGSHRNMDLYVTHSPCSTCWDALWASGRIRRIFFGAEFRDTSHLHQDSLFEMELYRVLPSGLVVDWYTGRITNAPS